MPAFTPITFLDTFDLAAALPPRMGLFRETADGHLLPLRGRGKEGERIGWYPAASKWPEMKTLVGNLQRIGEARLGEIEVGAVFLHMLNPGTATAWHPPEASPWIRTHLALRTNPGALMFAGREAHHLLPGQLTAVDLGAW